MITQFDDLAESGDEPVSAWTAVSTEQLVQEVYACADPERQNQMLAQLVAKVFEGAPTALRVQMLEHLLSPVGVVALMTIANGLFTRLRFRGGWPDTHLRVEDVHTVRSEDVMALVLHMAPSHGAVLNALADVLLARPQMAGSGAAAVLLAILLQRTRAPLGERRRKVRPISQFATL